MWIDIKLSKNQETAKEEATQNLKFAEGASEILLSRSEDLIHGVDLDWEFYEDFTVKDLCKELDSLESHKEFCTESEMSAAVRDEARGL